MAAAAAPHLLRCLFTTSPNPPAHPPPLQDTSGRHKNERVHYIPLCEVEADAAAAEQPVHQPAGTDGVKQEPAGDAAMAEAAAADAETPAAGDVKMEDGAEPAAAGTPDADARSAPADEDAAPATEPAAAAEHEGGSEEAPAPASTPERAALAAEVEGLDIPVSCSVPQAPLCPQARIWPAGRLCSSRMRRVVSHHLPAVDHCIVSR